MGANNIRRGPLGAIVMSLSVVMMTAAVWAQASEWLEQVDAQLAGIRDEIGGEFEAASDIMVGELAQAEIGEFTLQVNEGVEYFFMAVCDADCGDVDMALFDEDDNELVSDIEQDDYPYLHFGANQSGVWTVRVLMANCGADTCLWGAQGYAR